MPPGRPSLGRIAAACGGPVAIRPAVTLVAVSKTVDAEPLRDAVAAGLDLLGENRVQEAAAKAPLVPGARWHLVGPLQANKARRALEIFDVIESVDSVGLAERLDRLAARGSARCVATRSCSRSTSMPTRPRPASTRRASRPRSPGSSSSPALDVRGLMTIGRLVTDPEAARPTFRRLRELSAALRDAGRPIGPELSMGMTDDFEVAVEEGATIVRVGRALFGERHHPADPQ